MSVKIPSLQHRKKTKYFLSINKENEYEVRNGRFSEGKNDGGKKKGLSLNREENRTVRTTSASVQSSSVSKAKFQIYFDGSDENNRSRPRVRKDVCRKDIRARQNSTNLEKTIISTTKVAEINNLDSHAVSRRTRSSSNCRHELFLDKTIEMNNNLFHNRRAYSETRKISSQYVPSVQLSDGRKSKYLTNEVKKRTFSSIQMWKDKMRKPYTNEKVPKNITPNVDKIHAKTKLRKNSVFGSMDLQSEMSQNHVFNPNKNIEPISNIEPVSKVDSLSDVLRFLSNEIAVILKDNSSLKAQADTNVDTSTIKINSNTATPSDGPSSLPLTPTKVRYEKHMMTRNTLSKQENELDNLCETMYIRDYLEDIPDTERMKEDNAPRLCSRFLRENVNAEQRRLVVGYMIRLGVHCYYSSHVIYQTIKLFNVAIDRILVETNDIQLIALACLWITLKREAPHNKIPSATAILKLAKDLYINQEKNLLVYEKKILSAVKFNTRFADPFSLLSYYILNVNRDIQCNIVKSNDIACIYFCGSYMIDLSMLDESLCDIPVYVIVIAAVDLSLRFVYSSDVNVDQAWYQTWRNKQSLTEWEERVMNSTKRLMVQHAVKHQHFSSNVIYKKYMRSRHGKVTNFLFAKLKTVC